VEALRLGQGILTASQSLLTTANNYITL
jgi:hypothetical protein